MAAAAGAGAVAASSWRVPAQPAARRSFDLRDVPAGAAPDGRPSLWHAIQQEHK